MKLRGRRNRPEDRGQGGWKASHRGDLSKGRGGAALWRDNPAAQSVVGQAALVTGEDAEEAVEVARKAQEAPDRMGVLGAPEAGRGENPP